jgi:hypothetical protein
VKKRTYLHAPFDRFTSMAVFLFRSKAGLTAGSVSKVSPLARQVVLKNMQATAIRIYFLAIPAKRVLQEPQEHPSACSDP